MGWLLSEGTVVAVIAVAVLLALSPSVRRRARRGARASGRVLLRGLRVVGAVGAPAAKPEHRPIEVVAREARRIGRLYRATRTGVSFARSDAIRRSYDDILAEGCEALGLPHLLGLLEDGEELDVERRRVERLLHVWGIELDDAA